MRTHEGFDINLEGARAIEGLPADEKVRLFAGADYWSTCPVRDIPSITLTDGPNGLRKQTASFDNMGLAESLPATCFPSACASACTFDECLLELMGRALGEECRAEDVAVVLGPGVNIKRHPLGGRNFEYFSEDPILSGRMGAAFVRGVQSTGTGACLKHFTANSQETRRMTSDSVVDESTLNDIYMRAFEIAVKSGAPYAVMPAYNRLNGTFCAENSEILGKLRSWGFDGATVSDWGGMSQSVPSVAAGLDLCMPGPRPDHIHATLEAYEDGELSQESLDRAASAVAGLAKANEWAHANVPFESDMAEHLAIAQLVAEAGTVLLQNDGVLPLSRGSKIAVIGSFAKTPRYQGSGSSKVNPVALDCAWDAFAEAGFDVEYSEGFDADSGRATAEQIEHAAQLAASRDVAVVFAGLPDALESEGFDRKSMDLPESMNGLIERVIEANPRTVVVLSGGGCVSLPWRDGAGAVVATYLSGCRSGHAAVNVLSGDSNPSGRLAETWPIRVEDTALGTGFPVNNAEIHYIEGPFVGYRYYQAAGVPVAYPFGHGLSYTSFEYSGLSVRSGEDGYVVEFDVANTGECDGAEVVQLYVSSKESTLPVPPIALVDFKRVHIAAGGTVHVRFLLEKGAFSHWDPRRHGRIVERGVYEIRVGASCEDIRLGSDISIGADAPFPTHTREVLPKERREKLAPYFDVTPHGFTEGAFEELYARPLPVPPPARPITMDSRLADMRDRAFGRRLFELIEHTGRKMTVGDAATNKMLEQTFADMPMRSLLMGKVPYHVVQSLIDLLNRQPVRAIMDAFSRD